MEGSDSGRTGLRGAVERALSSEPFWVALALALRAGFVLCLAGRFYQADEAGYDAMARSIAEHGTFGAAGAAAVGTPGAGAFIALFYSMGHSLRAARLGLALLSTLTAWLIGRMTADLTGSRRAGLAALSVAAVYPFFIYYSGLLLTETVYLAWVVPGLWLLCKSLGEAGPGRAGWRLAAAGALLAGAGLTRAEAVPITLVLWAALAGLCALKRLSWAALALACLAWALPLGGWMARNKAVCGACALDVHGGHTLLEGTLLLDENEVDTSVAQKRLESMPIWAEGLKLGEYQRDKLFRAEAWRWMRENPGVVLRQWARKFVNFWRLYPRLDKTYADTPGMMPSLGVNRALLTAVSLAFEPALLALGLWGAWRLRRRAWEFFPLYWMVAASCAVHVIVVSQMRYRLGVMPIFILFACAAATRADGVQPFQASGK